MTNHYIYLKRRPTWYRFAIIMGVIGCLFAATQIKSYLTGHSGAPPFWSLLFIAALFTFAGMTEMAITVRWNDRSILMYPRWGFKFLGYKMFDVQIEDITSVSDVYMANENTKGLPFTTIEITDGDNAIRIRTDNFFRDGMQELVANIVRLRPDLELTDNLRAYVRGDFDGDWIK